ncbi:MAG: ABC transporter permease [Oscillospiraceae bacterium]|nr:ABC transporter permease [Oscillospiraceae bacterium]
MKVWQSFSLALKSLALSKMRAILTMLGIIIGVAAVIIIISLGDGIQDYVNESFQGMGANLVAVTIKGRNSSRNIAEEDMYHLAAENADCFSGVSPAVSVYGATVKAGNQTFEDTTVTGVSETYGAIRNAVAETGRFLQYVDVARQRKVCVIGTYLERELFNGDALGKTLKINGMSYQIVGILEEKAGSTSYGDDNQVLIPYPNAMKINGSSQIDTYYFSAVEGQSARAKQMIENRLYRTYEDSDAFFVMTMDEVLNTYNKMAGTIQTVLTAIAAISLLVGGIGIMNIMLVSVTERTREIGIRKAVGARRRDIMGQFVIEAATTSAVGGSIGIIVGIIGSVLIGSAFDIQATPSVKAVAISFVVSVTIGIVFGFLPANKAAKLHPIDALRHE